MNVNVNVHRFFNSLSCCSYKNDLDEPYQMARKPDDKQIKTNLAST